MSYADNYTDEMLEELEKKISKVYSAAQKDFEKQSKEYFEKFAKRDEEYHKLVDEGKITEKEYQQWRLNQIGRGERLDKMAAQMAERATNANEVAVAYVNDATPSIYSLNRNHEAYVIETLGYDMSVGGDFTLLNESSVRRLMVTDPDVMPYYPKERAIQRGIDLDYGQKYIKKHITSGILQGKSVYKIADDLQKDLTNMERASAIRTARTAVTSAQNGGRQDSMNAAAKMGIKLRKRWVSAKDMRVRDAHGKADGQTVNTDEPFIVGGEKMMFPGDTSSASGWNLYNCRCGMRTVEKEGIEAEKRQVRVYNPETGKNELVEDMTYEEWAKLRGIKSKKTRAKTVVQEKPTTETISTPPSVNGKDLSGKIDYSGTQKGLDIETAISAQGFDGVPKVVEHDEFIEAMNKSNFYAERTYAASSQDVLDAYRGELYDGKWYVDCSEGGAQYGKGMYCAASYDIGDSKSINGISSEMLHYKELGKQKGNNFSYTEAITLEPNAKIFELPHNVKAAEYIPDQYQGHYLLTHTKGAEHTAVEELIVARKKIEEAYATRQLDNINALYDAEDTARAKIPKELFKEADEAMKYYPEGFEKYGLYKNEGTLVAEMGYDAINAQGHGESGSYTVILNRTKVIFCKGGSIYGN